MYIEELNVEEEKVGPKEDEEVEEDGKLRCGAGGGGNIGEIGGDILLVWDAKRVLVGAGARALFYPTLLYNVVRNKVQTEFRWWDWIDEFLLLGAVPFPSDVKRLKELGVCGVVTLNEPYETLVPTSLYQAHHIRHLVLPTRDYLFAPSLTDICQAVDFIHGNALNRRSTYVHCKAGRGRSTTIVICYLVKYKQMMPGAAYDYVKSIRPRVKLASSQWQAVQDFYHCQIKQASTLNMSGLIPHSTRFIGGQDLLAFDDGSVVVITEADLHGYSKDESGVAANEIWADLSVIYRVRVAGEAALARLSCLWLRCHTRQRSSGKLVRESGCSVNTSQLGGITVDIHVFS